MHTPSLAEFCKRADSALRDDPELAARIAESLSQLIAHGPQRTVGFILAYAALDEGLWPMLGALDNYLWLSQKAQAPQVLH